MNSKISELLKLNTSPVAVVQSDVCPEKVLRFKPNQRGCVIASLVAASKGKIAAFTCDTTPCLGGRAGLGFAKYPLGWIEYFLSTGAPTVERCERYKKIPTLRGTLFAMCQMRSSRVCRREKIFCCSSRLNSSQKKRPT